MGTIKIEETSIVTTKNGIKEIWVKFGESGNSFITYNGDNYYLQIKKEEE